MGGSELPGAINSSSSGIRPCEITRVAAPAETGAVFFARFFFAFFLIGGRFFGVFAAATFTAVFRARAFFRAGGDFFTAVFFATFLMGALFFDVAEETCELTACFA
ncbi:MAG TPA: hypothetical protein VNX18_06795 [Bryobacteraceae bacterium]|nr:hypothetical protein [Bryobacteraceae bacterium]